MAECRYCHKRGHIAAICRTRLQKEGKPPGSGQTKTVDVLEEETPIEAPEYLDPTYTVRSRNSQPFRVDISVSGKLVPLEVDTSATLSVMPHSTYLSTWGKPEAPELKLSAASLHPSLVKK